MNQIIALGADHAGFELKEAIKKYLEGAGFSVKDCGCASKESVDYPDYAKAVALAVARQEAGSGGLVCNTGIGMSIAANKVAGVRAALVTDLFTAQRSRKHNDANVLCLGAQSVDARRALEILKTWLDAQFQGGRHARRVGKIGDLEKEDLC